MPGSFKDADAICPFYRGIIRKKGKLKEDDKKSIMCKDEMDSGYELELYFRTTKERDDYKKDHCDTYAYEKCKAYKAMGYENK